MNRVSLPAARGEPAIAGERTTGCLDARPSQHGERGGARTHIKDCRLWENPLPAASDKPTRDSSPRVASQCIRNPRRLLALSIPVRFTGSRFPVRFLCATLSELVTCAGLEPATRQFERLPARTTSRCTPSVSREILSSVGADCRNRTRVTWLEARRLMPFGQICVKLEPWCVGRASSVGAPGGHRTRNAFRPPGSEPGESASSSTSA